MIVKCKKCQHECDDSEVLASCKETEDANGFEFPLNDCPNCGAVDSFVYTYRQFAQFTPQKSFYLPFWQY